MGTSPAPMAPTTGWRHLRFVMRYIIVRSDRDFALNTYNFAAPEINVTVT